MSHKEQVLTCSLDVKRVCDNDLIVTGKEITENKNCIVVWVKGRLDSQSVLFFVVLFRIVVTFL